MAPTGITFEDVQKWAARDFPAVSKHLPDAKAFSVQFNIVRGYNHDNNFKSLVIGSTYTKTRKPAAIIAWLADTRIQVGYIGKNRNGEQQIRHMVAAQDTASSWNFRVPFKSILTTQGQMGLASFHAMLRYYFLAKGWSKGVIDEAELFNEFVAVFPHACRTVANAVAQGSGLDPKSYDDAHSQEASRVPAGIVDHEPPCPQRNPYLFEQIANDPIPSQSYAVLSSPSPSPPPTEVGVSPQGLRPVLEMHTQSKNPQEISPGRDDTGERNESGLRNKIFDLNIRLMIAEGLARDAETAAQKAQEEAQLWRKRYEEVEPYKIKYEEIRNHFGLHQ